MKTINQKESDKLNKDYEEQKERDKEDRKRELDKEFIDGERDVKLIEVKK